MKKRQKPFWSLALALAMGVCVVSFITSCSSSRSDDQKNVYTLVDEVRNENKKVLAERKEKGLPTVYVMPKTDIPELTMITEDMLEETDIEPKMNTKEPISAKSVAVGHLTRFGCPVGMPLDVRDLGPRENPVAFITRKIESDPENAQLIFRRAELYNRLGNPELAIEDCNRVIELTPGRYDAFQVRGNAYRKLKDYEHCVDDYSKALEILSREISSAQQGRDKSDSKQLTKRLLLLDRAKSYEALGKKDLAQKDIAKAKELGYKPEEKK